MTRSLSTALAIELDHLAELGRADLDFMFVGVLGVVVVEAASGQ